ncbi:FAD/FMN-containing isoamyl alcohol oxidase-like protein MreA [Cucurbitaria berberidis CBS 394.84]|uniref:FAD/FMN-containing isoamyl alcohol oxidase-like protein MreA n=1 Tax=Cucurbitaria berberidis CBS 394.84 TaxID=1168544 RepID=A0A9P4GAR1_9PLEO|nr:FAD/FMN-containing isoamyl alcohol oxidase-like protein MreA [Cucurbitaria berberidis CBS 394.84]KAF1842116.1 FAD/FMN-containing isoamyl alcohol oxidase-like protein MreA [Cucurbitaria berberidis CBS 394.84]
MVSSSAVIALFFVAPVAFAFNFPFESNQLKDSDVGNNSDIAFGKLPVDNSPRCKSYPGYEGWPSYDRWSVFNVSLNGALLKGIPPAAACYEGEYKDAAKCAIVRRRQGDALFAKEDPLIPFGQWQLDNPCPVPSLNVTPPLVECKLISFPAYVVNASTVKDIQLAVNFARNNRIRLTIKNTGHDWIGRNTGGGALQVWVHRLKAFEYLPSVQIAQYKGQAARVGAALEQHELYSNMGKANVTLMATGSATVGAYGGFMQGGGFSYVTSKYGLMADQVLALEVVTADGRFVHTDPEDNADLFWAIRGGGPGNFGIVTSAIVKAYPTTTVARTDFNFQTGPISTNSTTTVRVSNETFWKGVSVYFSHNLRINDAKGVMWNFIDTQAPSRVNPERTFLLRNQITKPGVTVEEMKDLIAPLIKDLNDVGIPLPNPEPRFWKTYADYGSPPGGPSGATSSGRFGSRLIPRSNLENPKSETFLATIASIRSFVEEGGYSHHSVDYSPSYETAGYPGSNSAVSPHLRNAVMHMTGYDTTQYTPDLTDEEWKASHARLDSYVQKWRDVSPGSGAYMNEVDTEEPNFQDSLYGRNYDRLLRIKQQRDPWSAFYAVMGVGSEKWKVEGTRGLPTQQGRLCRVDA